MKKPTIALLYDFDKTLSGKDQQEYTFIPSLGMTASEFWGEADRISRENNMDRILAYMFLMKFTSINTFEIFCNSSTFHNFF